MTNIFDELTTDGGAVRGHYAAYQEWLAGVAPEQIAQKRAASDFISIVS